MNIVNQNAVAHFDDWLTTYRKIDDLTRLYQYVAKSITDSRARMMEAKNRLGWRNMLLAWGTIEVLFAALSFLFVLLGVRSGITYLAMLFLLPAVLAGILWCAYRFRVVPVIKQSCAETMASARTELMSVYSKLSIQRQNLSKLSGGLNPECCNPLAIYIMRQATSDGACQNIYQAQRYFLDRRDALVKQDDDEDAVRTLERLSVASEEAFERTEFFARLDDEVDGLLKS